MVASPALADAQPGLRDFEAGRFGEAYQAWHDAAQAGDADAAFYLGVQFDVGEGVPADPGLALDWYRKAADLGNVSAMFNVAVIYDAGQTVARDPALALRFYQQAASFNYPRAEFDLGLIFQNGDGVPKDAAAARRWFARAYGHGVRAALPHLASLGAAPPRTAMSAAPGNPDRSIQAFEQAQTLLLGRDPAEKTRAVELFRAAAQANDPLAAYDLAYCYENAIGTPQNLVEAYRWYSRAGAIARDDELKDLARRKAALVAARLPPESRPPQAQAGY